MKPIKSILSILMLAKLFTVMLLIFFWITLKSQPNSTYSFLVAGHAYGAHTGVNIGLHPPFLKKLSETRDTSVMGLFLTGDIVNQSTTASWNLVEKELSGLGKNSFYVMGNHDNNALGLAVFKKKHGGAYYSLVYKNDLYIVLNSTESDRSISAAQLKFLDDVFANTDARWERAFIFFHEVIWNSNIKYKLVRSNSRSRYASIVNVSNFWTSVYPRLTSLPEKKFYLFAGDVGGNTDAIAASYDRWGNVTLLSSGMGEVKDENYMKVTVQPDTVTFQLIPLNDAVKMKPIEWYNIPAKPDTIIGPTTVFPSQSGANYQVSPVGNTTSYRWNLSAGITGSSDSSQINLRFDNQFQAGKISATAINDGFGESEPAELNVFSDSTTFISDNKIERMLEIYQNQRSLIINFNSDKAQNARIMIYDQTGRVILNDEFFLNSGFNSKTIDMKIFGKGWVIVELIADNKRFTQKLITN